MPRFFRATLVLSGVLSLAIHIAFFLAAFLSQKNLTDKPPPKLVPGRPVEVEWSDAIQSGGQGTKTEKAGDSLSLGKLSLGSLGFRYDFSGKRTSVAKSSGEASAFLHEHGQSSSAVRYLFDRIQGNVGYPEEFRLALMEGHIALDLAFNSKGEWERERTRIDSNSNFFKVHVMRQLRRALREPIPVAYRVDDEFSVHCEFAFKVTEHNDERLAKSLNYYSGRNIAVYRHWQHSKLQIDLGPMHGFLGVPFVGLDVIDAVKRIGDLFSNKPKKDPFQKYRDDPEWSS